MPRKLTMVLPSMATLSSLMMGVVAIMLLDEQRFLVAAILIMFGSILDVLDGQLAVRLEAVSDIGKELDSLADVVTFGVAPTLFLYHLMLLVGVAQPIAILSSLAFVVAGAFRLARFNVTPSNRKAYFQGMPIPMGCMLLITGSFSQGWAINIWWTLVVVMVSYLMVSPFPYPKVKHVTGYSPLVWAGISLYALACGLLGGWQVVPFALLLLYAVSGPLFGIWFARQKRQAQSI